MKTILFLSSLALLPAAAMAAEPNAAHGKTQFFACLACHTLTRDGYTPVSEDGGGKIGPNLYGVLGRKAASRQDYNYSAALKDSNIVWDEVTLDKFLTNPGEFVPGTKMTFPGIPFREPRANIIAYLKSLPK